ncbi:MAG: zinc ribbon domain-containing protein [Eubacterium sp.]|nr:zinc ribbon domain-containing protein [Eubacterium sp.]
MTTCPRCGVSVPNGVQICPQCGNSLAYSAPTTPPVAPATPTYPPANYPQTGYQPAANRPAAAVAKKSNNTVIIILAVALAVVIAVSGVIVALVLPKYNIFYYGLDGTRELTSEEGFGSLLTERDYALGVKGKEYYISDTDIMTFNEDGWELDKEAYNSAPYGFNDMVEDDYYFFNTDLVKDNMTIYDATFTYCDYGTTTFGQLQLMGYTVHFSNNNYGKKPSNIIGLTLPLGITENSTLSEVIDSVRSSGLSYSVEESYSGFYLYTEGSSGDHCMIEADFDSAYKITSVTVYTNDVVAAWIGT